VRVAKALTIGYARMGLSDWVLESLAPPLGLSCICDFVSRTSPFPPSRTDERIRDGSSIMIR
jgi:hypothetical protein